MKRFFLSVIIAASFCTLNAQSIFSTSTGTAAFFSETPLENINATSQTLNVILNTATNDIIYSVLMTSFKFERPLMQEHFNEKYVESDKFPKATFRGKINEKIDWTKDGQYEITATGTLEIHGVPKPYAEKATLTIKGGIISIDGKFNVKLVDHNIEVPKLVTEKIAETIKVTHSSTLAVYKKK